MKRIIRQWLLSNLIKIKIFVSLYQKIDLSNMECLNESEEGGGKRVFRPWQNRLDKGPSNCVISDCDEELLFNIPFTGNIKLKVSSMAIKKNDSATSQFYLDNYKSKIYRLRLILAIIAHFRE